MAIQQNADHYVHYNRALEWVRNNTIVSLIITVLAATCGYLYLQTSQREVPLARVYQPQMPAYQQPQTPPAYQQPQSQQPQAKCPPGLFWAPTINKCTAYDYSQVRTVRVPACPSGMLWAGPNIGCVDRNSVASPNPQCPPGLTWVGPKLGCLDPRTFHR